MPRKSIFDQEEIKIEHLLQEKHLDIIEKKDCLGVTLVFNQPMRYNEFTKQSNTITINPDTEVTRPINNSWKGMVMFFIALAALNYEKAFYSKYLDLKNSKYRPNFKLRIERKYTDIMDDRIRDRLKIDADSANDTYSVDFLIAMSGRTIEEKESLMRERNLENQSKKIEYLKEKFASLPRDDKIEEVPTLSANNKVYVQGKYEPVHIQSYIDFFAEMLDIDLELSTVKTKPSENIPHIYKAKGAQPVWDGSI